MSSSSQCHRGLAGLLVSAVVLIIVELGDWVVPKKADLGEKRAEYKFQVKCTGAAGESGRLLGTWTPGPFDCIMVKPNSVQDRTFPGQVWAPLLTRSRRQGALPRNATAKGGVQRPFSSSVGCWPLGLRGNAVSIFLLVSGKLHLMPHFSDVAPHCLSEGKLDHTSHTQGKGTFAFAVQLFFQGGGQHRKIKLQAEPTVHEQFLSSSQLSASLL